MKTLISIDGSSSIIGYTIFNLETKEFVTNGYILLNKETSLRERALQLDEKIKQLKEQFNITAFVIEEAFIALFGTSSNAATTATLLQINSMFQMVAHYNGLSVATITVNDSRKFTFPNHRIRTLAKQAKLKEKELCFNLAVKQFTALAVLPTKVLSKGPRKGQTIYEDFAYDIVDSYIVGYGYLHQGTEGKID